MQYADVAVASKTAKRQSLFTYQIPPELLPQIQPGQRVWVPFGPRQLIGTVMSLRRQPPKAQLKAISALADPLPFFGAELLAVGEQLALQFLTTIGRILDIASPKPAKRLAKQELTGSLPEAQPLKQRTLQHWYGLYEPSLARQASYLKLVDSVVKQQGSVLIITANQQRAQNLASLFAQSHKTVLLPETAQLSHYYQAWLDALSKEASVVIGTRKAVFCHLTNLKLIIVDEPSQYGHKSEQFPAYHSADVAKLRAQHGEYRLIFGDSAPRLEEYQAIEQQKLQLISIQANSKTELSIIDTSQVGGLLPESLTDHIKEALEKNWRIGLFLNRKGTAKAYRCKACESAALCQNCQSPLTVKQLDPPTILHCPECRLDQPAPYRCPICQNYRFVSSGFGIETIASKLRKIFPEAGIGLLSTGQTIPETQVIISTSSLEFAPAQLQFDLLICLQTEQLWSGTSWQSNEQGFLELSRLKERATQQLVLQTRQPDHSIIQAISTNNWRPFYQSELKDRTANHFPPAYPLTSLTLRERKGDQALIKTEKVYQALIQSFGAEAVFPPYRIKPTGKTVSYQIIVRTNSYQKLAENVPSEWLVDPKPDRIGG